MKKFISIFAIAAAMLACSKEEQNVPANQAGSDNSVLYAVVNAPVPDTKTVLGEEAEGVYSVSWREGDGVTVLIDGARCYYTVASVSATGVATLTYAGSGDAPEGTVTGAIYPHYGAAESDALNNEKSKKADQDYVGASFDGAAAKMTATVVDGTLNVHSTADDNGKYEGYEQGVTLGSTASTFVIAVAPGQYEDGISVAIETADGRLMVKEGITSQEFLAGHIYGMKELVFAETPGYLSRLNHQANCYIVTEAGTYYLDASVMGRGAKGIIPNQNFKSGVLSPKMANTVWELGESCEVVESGSLVSGVKLIGKILKFNASSAHGNALIGIKSAAGNYRWSWHIWMPVENPVAVGPDGKKALNMNIGAMKVVDAAMTADEFKKTFGLLYQWGRKDPFPGCAVSGTLSEIGFGRNSDDGNRTVDFIMMNPATYVGAGTTGTKIVTWDKTNNKYLWGQGTSASTPVKTIYDPSPYGYKVPDNNFFTDLNKSKIIKASSNIYYYDAEYKLPASGFRNNASGDVNYDGTKARYWSAYDGEDSKTTSNARLMRFNAPSTVEYTASNKTYGFSVRPAVYAEEN